MKTRAGQRSEVLTFQRRSTTLNAFNEPIDEWSDFIRVAGAVEPLRGDEIFDALQTQGVKWLQVSCIFSPRLAQVTHRDRVMIGAVFYDIQSVLDPEMRHRELVFMIREHEVMQDRDDGAEAQRAQRSRGIVSRAW